VFLKKIEILFKNIIRGNQTQNEQTNKTNKKMSSRVAKKQLSDEELRVRAAHELIAAEVDAVEPVCEDKTPIWQDLGSKTKKLYLESVKLAKEGLPLTPAHKEARYLRNSWYRKKSGKKSGKAVPVVEAPVGQVVWPSKPAPEKKEPIKKASSKKASSKKASSKKASSKKAKKKYENKTPNTTDEEYECWREYNKKGSSSQEPSRKEKALRYKSIKHRFEREQKNPNIKKKRSKYDNDIKLEEPILPALVVVEPLVVTPVPKRVNALDDLAAQYASDDEDAEEHFYANWRPTPAPRTFNSNWRPTPAPRPFNSSWRPTPAPRLKVTLQWV